MFKLLKENIKLTATNKVIEKENEVLFKMLDLKNRELLNLYEIINKALEIQIKRR